MQKVKSLVKVNSICSVVLRIIQQVCVEILNMTFTISSIEMAIVLLLILLTKELKIR